MEGNDDNFIKLGYFHMHGYYLLFSTALSLAALFENIDTVKLLVENGASLELVDNDGE